jgi:transcriptional regulator with XRE-family HTH domain
MGFRENLKEELLYSGLLVKELSKKSGINKRTIDKYLTEHGSLPSADAAVKIARALGVSAEYLVTGQAGCREKSLTAFSPDIRALIQIAEELDKNGREALFAIAASLKKWQSKWTAPTR